jgi:hypothetical protein
MEAEVALYQQTKRHQSYRPAAGALVDWFGCRYGRYAAAVRASAGDDGFLPVPSSRPIERRPLLWTRTNGSRRAATRKRRPNRRAALLAQRAGSDAGCVARGLRGMARRARRGPAAAMPISPPSSLPAHVSDPRPERCATYGDRRAGLV